MAQENNSKEFRFSSVDLIVFAWEKRIPLIIITVVAVLASIIISLTMTNLYKSKVVLFPAPNTSVSKYLFSNQSAGPIGLLAFGEEEQTEQLLQVLQSDQIKNRIIEKFDLINHYEIDPDLKYKYTVLNNKMKKYIKYKRTKYMSVVVEVLDKDPVTAANIANEISDLVDTTMNKIQRERATLAFKLVEQEYVAMENHIKQMEDSLAVLRSYGIFDYVAQSEELWEGYSDAINDNDERAMRIFEKKMDTFAKYGGSYISISDFVVYEKRNFGDLTQKYIQAKVEAEQNLPQKFVVDRAAPDVRKAYPKRSLIVIQSALSAFILGYIVLLIISILRRNKTVAR
jgi:tyrosine-protein kinase Etk/Wzc